MQGKKNNIIRLLSAFMTICLLVVPVQTVLAAETSEMTNKILINEVNSSPDDWVELMNIGDTALDLTGWEIRDNSDDHRWQFAAGTIIEAGSLLLVKANSVGLIFDDSTDAYVEGVFDEAIGIGSGDSVRLYDAEGNMVDSHSWTEHANVNGDESASWGRYPDGTGSFVLMPETAGTANGCYPPAVVINEVQSSAPNDGPDWIELANPTDWELDISGIVIKDNDDTHEYVIPEGTTIPANGFMVITSDEFGFGLGKGDSVRLFEDGTLIASTTWEGHTNPTWGLYPDATGNEYRGTLVETPGTANLFAGIPEVNAWPGAETVTSSNLNFLEDSSGLDFHNGQLYAVDNGTGKYWIMDVAVDGTLTFAKGFEDGKIVNFVIPSAKGADTEGITVDGDGFVYLASERDNSNKGVNYNVILMADPKSEDVTQNAMQQWDLTSTLPDVAANTGIEAVEWVANADMIGVLFDQNTNTTFDPANYPNAVAGGVFFVALEDNGHVYAYVLNADSTVVQIADIDGKLGGAMALDYDTYEKKLWVVADDGYANMAAIITFNGNEEPDVVHVTPAADVDVGANNEGFAIAAPEFTINGQRPVYRFTDGITSGALTIGSIDCTYTTHTHSFTNYVSDGNAICETDGTKTAVCACGMTDTVVDTGSQKGHSYKDGDCTVCGKIEPGLEENPKTGDSVSVAPWTMLLLVSVAGIGVMTICGMKQKHPHNH